MAVQWLRLYTSTAGDMGSVPGWGTRIPHASQYGQKNFFLINKGKEKECNWFRIILCIQLSCLIISFNNLGLRYLRSRRGSGSRMEKKGLYRCVKTKQTFLEISKLCTWVSDTALGRILSPQTIHTGKASFYLTVVSAPNFCINLRPGCTLVVLAGKKSACHAGDPSSIPRSGRSPGEGNGDPLQYSCLENTLDRGAWWATVLGVEKSWTQLNDFHFTLHLGPVPSSGPALSV